MDTRTTDNIIQALKDGRKNGTITIDCARKELQDLARFKAQIIYADAYEILGLTIPDRKENGVFCAPAELVTHETHTKRRVDHPLQYQLYLDETGRDD